MFEKNLSELLQEKKIYNLPIKLLVQHLLEKYGITAKKKFGQHFLFDASAFQKIILSTDIQSTDTIIEIGPGIGTLTAFLLANGANVIAVEKDPVMCNLLRKELSLHPNFNLIEKDALSVHWPDLLSSTGKNKTKVVGNLPYNVGTEILMQLLPNAQNIGRMVFMLQKEVADRITADPGSRTYGALSANVQLFCHTKRLALVKPGSFFPPPKVDSAILGLIPKENVELPNDEANFYQFLVRSAFQSRRKTIENSLGHFFDSNQLKQAFVETSIIPNRRAETLSVKEFISLAKKLFIKNKLS